MRFPLKRGLVFALAVAIALPVCLRAQTLDLTLEKAIETALENNHDLEVARLVLERANADVQEAFGYALPSIDITAGYTRTLKKSSFPLKLGDAPLTFIETGVNNAFNSRVDIRQTLFNSAVFTGVGTAKIYQKAAREQLEGAVAKMVLEVKRAYYYALLTREALKLQEASLLNAESNHRDVDVLFQEGFVSEYDAIRAEVQVENLRPAVLQAENAYNDALNNLKVVLGLDAATAIDVIDELAYTPGMAPNSNLNEVRDAAIKGNYDLRVLELQTQVNNEIITVNKSEFLPTLELFGNYALDYQGDEFDDMHDISSSAVGVELKFSLFNGFRSTAKVEKARRDYLQSEEQYLALRTSVEARSESVLNAMQTAVRRIEAQKRTVDQAERGYEIARTRYTEGVGGQLEINDADLQLRQARLNRITSVHDFLVSIAELEELTGKLDPRYIEILEIQD